jgi:hydrogenase maturation protease
VGGFGVPGLRDLDFGRLLIDYVGQFDWPEDVVVEDLSYAAPLVLHRLQELRPAKVVLVGAATRSIDAPGTIRRYRPHPRGEAGTVHEALAAAVGGMVDIDRTLTVVHHWGALPQDTVVIEIEPADTSLGLGFSEEVGATIEAVVAMLREEVGDEDSTSAELALGMDERATPGVDAAPASPARPTRGDAVPASEAVAELVNYGTFHEGVSRTIQGLRQALGVGRVSEVDGLSVAARLRPLGGLGIGGGWYDVIPLDGGWVGVAVGDVAGRGVQAAAVVAQLRAATWAYALVDGPRPARVLARLDRLVEAMDVGRMTTMLYLAVHPGTGQVRLSRAGHCPPLLLAPTGAAEFFEEGRAAPLGGHDGERPEPVLQLSPGSTLLAFTDGLVESRHEPLMEGMGRLRRAAANGPSELESLCDHIVTVCRTGRPQPDDFLLVGIRLDSDCGR